MERVLSVALRVVASGAVVAVVEGQYVVGGVSVVAFVAGREGASAVRFMDGVGVDVVGDYCHSVLGVACQPLI